MTKLDLPKLADLETEMAHMMEFAQKLKTKAEERKRGFSIYNVLLLLKQCEQRFPEYVNEIDPYVNVLTFNVWKDLGRKVKKGEKAMKTVVFKQFKKEEKNKQGKMEEKEITFPKVCNLFAIWQTEEI